MNSTKLQLASPPKKSVRSYRSFPENQKSVPPWFWNLDKYGKPKPSTPTRQLPWWRSPSWGKPRSMSPQPTTPPVWFTPPHPTLHYQTMPPPLPFPEECDSKVEIWSQMRNFWAATFIPAIGVNHELSVLTHLGCWLTKEANATSRAIEDLLEDTQRIKTMTLQNRAAVDCLLLAHGHGCQDFEGMSCMNFSDNSESIYQSRHKLKALVKDIHAPSSQSGGPELPSLSGLFSWLHLPNIPQWLRTVIGFLIIVLIIIFVILVMIPFFLACARKLLTKTVAVNFLLKDKKGGDVGDREAPEETPDGEDETSFAEWKARFVKGHSLEELGPEKPPPGTVTE
ncbi:hypothetical protein BTVI_13966 [Pitangus sulphuratus]|nr:hypothetical protein BTVI_13966 [Pitangus sulphuratus]